MKVIFLDVDGVLNTGMGRPDPDKIRLVKRIIDSTKAKVVLSTAWREVPHLLDQLKIALAMQGIVPEGMTPVITDGAPYGWDFRAPRHAEIAAYRAEHKIKEYVILDDWPLANDGSGRMIQTETEVGLTEDHVEMAIRILNDRSRETPP